MVEVTIKTEKKVVVKWLLAQCGVRYWEDAVVNGQEDVDGALIPFRVKDCWCPKIDVDTGRIIDWPAGTTARIHYKVCDDGTYWLWDADENVVATKEGYVPAIMCPEEDGFGDYVIMNVDETGQIANWKPALARHLAFGQHED